MQGVAGGPSVVEVVTLAITSGSFALVLGIAFKAGAFASRLEALEKRVNDIDLFGCRHRRAAADPPESECG